MPELRQEEEERVRSALGWHERNLDSRFRSPKSNGKSSKNCDQRVTRWDLLFQRSLTLTPRGGGRKLSFEWEPSERS